MPTDREPRAASTAAAKKLSPQSSTKPLPQVVEKKQQTKSSSTKRAHPTYQDMIISAIEEEGDKSGASRPVIKKYIIHRYGMEDTHHFDSQVAAAIRRGHDKGTFELPKGFGGKIKIAEHHKENSAPANAASKKSKISGGTARTRVLAKKTQATSNSKSTALKPKKTSKAQAKTSKASTSSVVEKKKAAAKVSPVVEVPAKSKKTAAVKKTPAKAKTANKKTVSAKK
ncbi:hypothetical protein JCM5350_006662 [Sporobolomyces pararoseus]